MRILYLCPDSGIPVLGHKGASVHVREMVAALGRGGHKVVLAAQTLSKSVWEKPVEAQANLLQVQLNANSLASASNVKEFVEQLGIESSLPGELRRILFNRDFLVEVRRRCEPPDFIYERASLYS